MSCRIYVGMEAIFKKKFDSGTDLSVARRKILSCGVYTGVFVHFIRRLLSR